MLLDDHGAGSGTVRKTMGAGQAGDYNLYLFQELMMNLEDA